MSRPKRSWTRKQITTVPNTVLLFLLTLGMVLSGCSSIQTSPDLGHLYNELAQQEDPLRNPVIVIPGILGSRLVEKGTNTVAWGAFGLGQADPNSPDGARLVALPMAQGQTLKSLKDTVYSDGALDRVVVNFFGFPVQLNAYYNILRTLGVGGYRDEQLGEAKVIDYGDRHYTCFQFAYDWRRDIVESAQALDRFIKNKQAEVEEEIERRFGVKRHGVKFDVVAHSMGSLVARWYLRYGAAELPEDGSMPKLTWAGAQYIDHLVMIGPPNAGSAEAIQHLVHGLKPAVLFPDYSSAILGTLPSVYQLLPRSRNRPLLDTDGQPVEDIFDPELWKRLGWGLADPAQAKTLEYLLPEIIDPKKRRQIALDHQRKALARAKQVTQALDVPAKPPMSVRLVLVAGDAVETMQTLKVNSDGTLEEIHLGPGDGTVLRSSALMDERGARSLGTRLISPIGWSYVLFLFSDHLGITEDPAFIDNILYFLLESPRAQEPEKT